jgi:hypothetical protein
MTCAANSKTVLLAGTIVEHKTTGGEWKRIPRLTTIGAVGEQSEPKEDTTLEDDIRTYGSGLRDAPDKNLSGQYIPKKESGDELYDDYLLQQEFFDRLKCEEEFDMRVTYPDGDVYGWLHKAFGFQIDEGTQEDWKMWTSNGKQNTRVIYTSDLTITGGDTVAALADLAVALESARTGLNLGTVVWSSSDELIATVVAGVDTTTATVTGVAAGSVTITAEARGVAATLDVTVTA